MKRSACLRVLALLLAPTLACAAVLAAETTSFFAGMCDASAAVALDSRHLIAANDEDNILRLYDVERGGDALQTFNLAGLKPFKKLHGEMDLEGAARIGTLVFWLTSHGRNQQGETRPARRLLFATSFDQREQRWELKLAGTPCSSLIEALAAEPKLRPFDLKAASKLAPKEPGGLNIEGLAATPAGHLLIGFRNPVPGGRTLLVPLTNPQRVLEGTPPQFGDPVLLDLGGRGIRDIAAWGDRFVLVAGAPDGAGRFHLHAWNPRTGQTPRIAAELPPHFHPEAIVYWPDRPGEVQVLSDDGNLETRSVPCKKLTDPSQRAFRSLWVKLPRDE